MVHLVGRLHDEPLPKHVDPARLRPEGCGFLHYIHDVVVLKNVFGDIRICPGAIHIDGPDSFIFLCYAEDQIEHFVLCVETITAFFSLI